MARSKAGIMADVYGSRNDVLFQSGLADPEDKEDFHEKVESLKSV